jgi:hypothetical protein
MTGRKGLTWVTALTVASLLLGGGAMNALADGHGRDGGRGGGGQGNAGHQQQQKPEEHKDNGKHEGEASRPAAPAVVQNGPSQTQATNRHDDDDDRGKPVVDRKRDDDDEDEDEDLVTRPERVTDEVRPGLGCGDDNHRHTGPPGNPDKECKQHEDANDDDDDANTATVAAANDDLSIAVVDDRDDN